MSKKIQYITQPFQFQLQIPIRSVVKVSKEKTAKIIPNAVGLATATEKHVSDQLTYAVAAIVVAFYCLALSIT